jgi:outer membrane protein OmpA-like peptidoglycan-associated protein
MLIAQQVSVALASESHGLQPAPSWVRERIASAAPDLYFAANSQILAAPEQRTLLQIVPALQDVLRDFPDLIIVIEGYADDGFPYKYNEQLGKSRANAVRRLLRNLSFPEDRLRVASFGFRATQCEAQDGQCRKETRRVHFRAAVAMSKTPANKP